jgi:hypothetical protein
MLHAEKACAIRPPPSSRVVSAASTTVTAKISTAGTRAPVGVSPNAAIDAFSSSGVSGGWST